MSTWVITALKCDTEGCPAQYPGRIDETATQLRRRAEHEAGWISWLGKIDFCAEHSSEPPSGSDVAQARRGGATT